MEKQINTSTNNLFDELLEVINNEITQLKQAEEKEEEEKSINNFKKRLREETTKFVSLTETQQEEIKKEAECIQFIVGELCCKTAIAKKEIEHWQSIEKHQWSKKHVDIQLTILKYLEKQKTEYTQALVE